MGEFIYWNKTIKMGGEESKQLNEINNNKIKQSINDLYKKEDKNKNKMKIINEKNGRNITIM